MSASVHQLQALPPPMDLETVRVLKALAAANRALAELKGRTANLPISEILIDALSLQEAMASSEIENIVATQDELFQASLLPQAPGSPAAKEVVRHSIALKLGYERLSETNGIISNNTLVDMFRLLKGTEEGFRVTPGTVLQNEATGETVHVQPQNAHEIVAYMSALERFINDDQASTLDPLIKMALIHHQFESIHPFSDCNGRVGRILSILYIVRTGLLDTPILYLSRYFVRHKSEYFRLLQVTRESGAWEDWVVYMLQAITETSKATLQLVEGISTQMTHMKRRLRSELPRLHSQDLLNNLFRHPYTRIAFLESDLGVSRATATKYLEQLTNHGFVQKHRTGRNNYYVNRSLFQFFLSASKEDR